MYDYGAHSRAESEEMRRLVISSSLCELRNGNEVLERRYNINEADMRGRGRIMQQVVDLFGGDAILWESTFVLLLYSAVLRVLSYFRMYLRYVHDDNWRSVRAKVKGVKGK